ncbi:MAG: Xaa-Pro aminopeptidase [Alphaproteobacteria bacterium]|jgi:Xaa-Pro aminopeptidase
MTQAKLIYGCGADSFYATKLEMHDDYIWFMDEKGETHILLNALEIGRGKKVAKVDHVHAITDIIAAMESAGHTDFALKDIVTYFVNSYGVDTVEVPKNFPAGAMVDLQSKGLKINVKQTTFFESRIIKTAEEIEKIRTCQQINEQAFARAFEVLQAASINKDLSLSWQGNPLTSEIIQGLMNSKNAEQGCIGFNGGPIVACGAQAADPHNRGTGLLYANEFIIIDSFPHGRNAYNGDLTRTVLKGEASDWHLDLYNAVKTAQQMGLDTAKAGVTGAEVHKVVDDVLIQAGFKTGTDENGDSFGFFHGTGHALGLEVHDDGPGVSPRNKNALLENMVVTIEPGLYYPGKGGARIEDIVAITKDGVDNLTTLPKKLLVDKL